MGKALEHKSDGEWLRKLGGSEPRALMGQGAWEQLCHPSHHCPQAVRSWMLWER